LASSDETVHQEQGFLSHLIELRDRLLKMILAVVLLFIPLFLIRDQIYTRLAEPLSRFLPEGTEMIAYEVASPFLIPLKLSLMVSVFLAIPFLSTLLFYAGVAFAYFVVFPLVFKFLINVAPAGVQVSPDIARYLDFVITMFFAFGIAFEVPVATVLLVVTGVTTPEKLVKMRPYVFVGAFIIGMFLTPPDVISQILLAVPMYLLFEVGVLLSSRFKVWIKDASDAREEMQEEEAVAESTAESAAESANKSASKTSTGGYRNSLTDHVDDSKGEDGGP